MAKYKPKGKGKKDSVPRSGIPCMILLVSAIFLACLLVYLLLKSGASQ